MFRTREEAGELLGKRILEIINGEKPGLSYPCTRRSRVQTAEKPGLVDFVVLGIPRGGVVVAGEVAKILGCPLDMIVVKKIGAPNQEELAIGAMGKTKGSLYFDERLARDVGADGNYINNQQSTINNIIQERERTYRQGKQALNLKGKTAIIVDDGAATGATMISAAREVRSYQLEKVIIALPVVARDTLEKLKKEVDQLFFLEAPLGFEAVGQFYQEFPQVGDEEVVSYLAAW